MNGHAGARKIQAQGNVSSAQETALNNQPFTASQQAHTDPYMYRPRVLREKKLHQEKKMPKLFATCGANLLWKGIHSL